MSGGGKITAFKRLDRFGEADDRCYIAIPGR